MNDGEWRTATAEDAALLAELASEVSGSDFTAEQASAFLKTWRVEIAPDSAVAVLPPASGHSRGHGAWWQRHGSAQFDDVVRRMVRLALTHGVETLQISLPAEESGPLGFDRAYPLWTMVHDGTTWPQQQSELPPPLRISRWSEVQPSEFQTAYEQAYQDQRVVEPHTAATWEQLASSNDFATDLAALATTPDGRVAGFVLGFHQDGGGVELGPIGTVPSWRGRGVSSALLASVLMRCRELHSGPLTLTVDGESPTGAQHLYLRYGFLVDKQLVTYQCRVPAG
ncbi:GNAT family N-acetyltransferase [Kribbella sp. NBC_00709]|uniref:GNAT family N-acetyltransferase n=1 Tax=Kribbella sp. NBC_00709 TaxID=2975972 RepID=UPI002E2E607B|nr:GNAT family N-acetyltransferase [Kribbella sp. NBC_00709]